MDWNAAGDGFARRSSTPGEDVDDEPSAVEEKDVDHAFTTLS